MRQREIYYAFNKRDVTFPVLSIGGSEFFLVFNYFYGVQSMRMLSILRWESSLNFAIRSGRFSEGLKSPFLLGSQDLPR